MADAGDWEAGNVIEARSEKRFGRRCETAGDTGACRPAERRARSFAGGER
jgi:hypothetical protein